MLRKFLSSAFALVLLAGLAPAEDRKPEGDKRPEGPAKEIMGKVKKVDAKKGVLTVTVTKDGKDEDVEVEVTAKTRFMAMGAGRPKELTGKAGLKAENFKPGARVRVATNEDGKAMMVMAMPTVRVGGGPNGFGQGMISGKIKKVDADKGILVITIKKDGESKDRTIKVTEDTMFMSAPDKGKPKRITGKEGLKGKAFKVGGDVHIFEGPDGKKMIMVGNLPSGPFGPMGGPDQPGPAKNMLRGTIKKIDAEKKLLTLKVMDEDEDVQVKFTAQTRFMVMGANPSQSRPKSYTAKEVLKAKEFKAGAMVMVGRDPRGNVMMVMVMPEFKKPEKDGVRPDKDFIKPKKDGDKKDGDKKDGDKKDGDKDEKKDKEKIIKDGV